MNVLSQFFYETLILLIKFCKVIESFVYRCFPGIVKRKVNSILKECDITVNGTRDWDVVVHNEHFFRDLVTYGSIGFGEGFMKGDWHCDNLEELSYIIFDQNLFRHTLTPHNRLYMYLLFDVFNLQTKSRSWEVGKKHYDLGNDLFTSFLDPTLNYSCGYWKHADNLNQAQIDKMELIAQKLKLKPGMKVLDIGCGWGSLCKYLAEKYKVIVVGCTVSVEQEKYAKKLCEDLPVDIRLVDYRDIKDKFDRIVSVGMFEHVGQKNYRTFFTVASKCLNDDGIFLLHTIGVNHSNQPLAEPWSQVYIFPNGVLPYYKHITQYSEGLFIIEDWQNFGHYYNLTLNAWYENFVKSWPKLQPKYGDEFFRMWTFYLKFGAGAFKSRKFNLWQIVFSKNGLRGGYEADR